MAFSLHRDSGILAVSTSWAYPRVWLNSPEFTSQKLILSLEIPRMDGGESPYGNLYQFLEVPT
jgi:hypothetical protein